MNIKINMSKNAEKVINILEKNGYEGYIVGGCVRDALLNRQYHDEDITTNCKPEECMNMFLKLGYTVIPSGLKHGTITVMIHGTPYEITTFRNDGNYSDGRHPDNVEFSNSLKDDLCRRDFTNLIKVL